MKITFLKLKRASKPTKDFKKELWGDLEVAYVKIYPGKTKFLWGKFVAVPALVIVMLVTTGTGVYAYSSPNCDAEDGLFIVKEGIESVEMQFYRLAGAEQKHHERMLERRFEEAERRYERGDLSDRHLEMIEARLAVLEALEENTPELAEVFSAPEEIFEDERDGLLEEELEEMTSEMRRHRRYEEMRNTFHGERVQEDEARMRGGDEEVLELNLSPRELIRMEALR